MSFPLIRRERVRSENEFRLNLRPARFALLRFGRPAIIGYAGRSSVGSRFLFRHVGEPRSWRRVFAGSNFEEDFLNLLGDFSASACTNRNAIDRTDGGNL